LASSKRRATPHGTLQDLLLLGEAGVDSVLLSDGESVVEVVPRVLSAEVPEDLEDIQNALLELQKHRQQQHGGEGK